MLSFKTESSIFSKFFGTYRSYENDITMIPNGSIESIFASRSIIFPLEFLVDESYIKSVLYLAFS